MTRSGRKNRVVMLARYPRLGEVKTRLVPPMTAEEALDLHDRLTRHTLRALLAVQATGEARAEVRTDAAFARVAYDWLGRGFSARYQGEGDLGDRIRLACGESFAHGDQRVVVVGSDCPRLHASHLRDALRRLDGVDVVLGPADDGGYYLVALAKARAKESVPVLFSGVEWGTDEVLDRTLAICEEHGLSWALLERLPDVDRPEDVADAELALAADTLPADARVSVVIPALDDAELVGAADRERAGRRRRRGAGCRRRLARSHARGRREGRRAHRRLGARPRSADECRSRAGHRRDPAVSARRHPPASERGSSRTGSACDTGHGGWRLRLRGTAAAPDGAG